MFSRDEAFSFIRDFLDIHDAESRAKVKATRRHLLDDVVTRIQCRLPFHTLKLLSVPREHRCRPSLDVIRGDFLSGVGGLCYSMNVSLHFLLKAIGFNSSLALSSVTSTKLFPPNHVVVYVTDVEKEGDAFLADAGCGFPTFRVISLDFEKESLIFTDCHLEYKYVKHDGKILRMHRKGCPLIAMGSHGEADLYIDGWRRFYDAEPAGTDNLSDLDPYYDRVFTDPEVTNFHTAFRVQGCREGRWVVVNRATLMIEDDGHTLVKCPIEGGEEGVIATVQKFFPMLDRELISSAFRNLPP